MELNLEGVVVGAASLLVIGAFHPLVIWCEYRFTQRVWPVFLIAGLLCLLAALLKKEYTLRWVTNGREAWVNRDLEYRTVSAPIRIGATVAVADYEGYVTMMNPANGEVVGRTRLDGAVRAPAAQFGYGAVFQTVEGEVAYVLQESLGE